MKLPLAGRVAVITGVSRRKGIGFAIAARLAAMGASLFVQHCAPHDAEQPWGADDVEGLLGELRTKLTEEARLGHAEIDFSRNGAADQLIDAASAELGHLDVLVCNHARSGGDGRLAEMTAARLDAHWQVNTRSTLLATRRFANQHDGRPGGNHPHHGKPRSRQHRVSQ